MVDKAKLAKFIEDSPYKISGICSKAGFSRGTFRNKLNGKSEYTISEAMTLAEMLGMTDSDVISVFFAKEVH